MAYVVNDDGRSHAAAPIVECDALDPIVYTPDQWANDLPGPYVIDVGGVYFQYEGAFMPWSISAPDQDTVRFEIHDNDKYYYDKIVWKEAERNEIASAHNVALNGQPVQVSYGFTLEPGAPNTARWMVVGQLHSDLLDPTNGVSPPVEIVMQGERMAVVVDSTGPDGKQVATTVWADAYDIDRGHQYQMDIKLIPDPTGQVSRLVVVRDGVTIVDYNGPIGDTYMNGVYFAYGIYRADNASETQAVDYSNLTIKTGDAVSFPSAQDFIAAPILSVPTVIAEGGGAYAATLQATAKIGTTVSFYEGKTLLGTGTTDSQGHASLSVQLNGDGTHLLYSVATDGTGRSGVISGALEVIVSPAAAVMSQLVAMVNDKSIGAIVLSDTNILVTSSAADLNYLFHHPELLTKIQGTAYFNLVTTVSGQAYDRQIQTYAIDGTLLEMQRYSSDRLTFDQTYSGARTVTTSWAADGASTIVTSVSGKTATIVSHDAAGHLTSQRLYFADSSIETDTFSAASGSLTRASVIETNGATVDVSYGIAGKPYVTQASVNIGGKSTIVGRYDALDRLVSLVDQTKLLTATFSYDAATGLVATTKLVASDNSYSLTTYLPGGQVVASTAYFTAKGVYLGQDLSDPTTALSALSPYVVINAPLAPVLTVADAVSASATTGSATLSGTGHAHSAVTLYDGDVAIGTGIVDATGHVALAATGLGAGRHVLSAVAMADDGASHGSSAAITVEVGTQQTILSSLSSLAAQTDLAAIVMTDSPVVHVSGTGDVAQYLRYGATLAKIAGGIQFEIDQTIVGKSYDHQIQTYDQTGAAMQLQRLAGGQLLMDNVSWGSIQINATFSSNGGYSFATLVGGKASSTTSATALGTPLTYQTPFADGSRQTTTFDTSGKIVSTLFAGTDGTQLSSDYGITGKSYVRQAFERDASGHLSYGIRWDAAGHVTMVTNILTGDSANFSYDAAGQETGYRLTHKDNSYSVTSLVNGGVSTVAYDAKGTLIGHDGSDPAAAIQTAILTMVAAANGHAAPSGTLSGTSANDLLVAGATDTLLSGGAGADTLIGGAGNDVIIGGAGTDIMTGGGGKDLFWFAPGDFGSSTTAGADRITDFSQGDRIDLSMLANQVTTHAGLSFIGSGAFDGKAGEIRYFEQSGNTYVAGDLNGDKQADVTIQLDGHHVLHQTDFLL